MRRILYVLALTAVVALLAIGGASTGKPSK